nr:RING finger protein 24-like isoform X2 [Oncorhynchus gorbuscha]
MSSDFQHYSFRMPNIGFQNLPLNIYIVVFGTAIFVFILSLLFCCYLIRSLSLSLCSERLRLLVTERTLKVKTKMSEPYPVLSPLLVEGPGCITSGRDWESHRVVHKWPSSIQVWPGLRHQAHKELYAYKQVIQKEKVKELNLHEICAVCLEEFKQKDELGICPCKHAFHRKCLIKWLEVRKVCPLCNMPVLQLAQQAGVTIDVTVPIQQHLPGVENLV